MAVNPFPQNIKKIAIAAPAGPCPETDFSKAREVIESFGIEVVTTPNAFNGTKEKYFSAGLHQRLDDIHSCWRDNSIDMILCARGGYGTAKLLPHLDWELLRSRPLPIVGLSDITALHLGMLSRGVSSAVSSCVAKNFCGMLEDEFSIHYMKKALHHEKNEIVAMPEGREIKIIRDGTAAGPAIFANLTVMATLCGTEFMPDMTGAILFVEDINEAPYKIDRCLNQLQMAGVIMKLSALVFSSFDECGPQEDLNHIFESYAGELKGPVLSNFPFGHSRPCFSYTQGRRIAIKDGGMIYTE